MVKERVDKINARQKKIQEREHLLTEKQNLLFLQEKKQECHKQAINEEWNRIDEKRCEVLKCHKLIDDEWKILVEETRQFDILKSQDREVKIELQSLRKKMSDTNFEDVNSIKSRIERDNAEITQEWQQLNIEKQTMEDKESKLVAMRKQLAAERRQIAIEKKELQFDKMSIEKEKQDIDENRRDLSLLMPSIKKLMSNK